MKKKLLAISIFFVIAIVIWTAIYINKHNSKNEDMETKVQFEYNSNMSVLSFQNTFLIYDGKKLIKKSDTFKDVFALRLVASNYVIKTMSEDIYILDKTEKILYKISKDGEIVNQVKFVETGQNIYPLKNSDVVLQYSTGVNTDGIIIYDKDLKKKKDINYPNGLVNTIAYEERTNNLFVSIQVVNELDVINSIYVYDFKYEPQLFQNYKNLVTMALDVLGNNILILDPTALYIMDKDFKNVSKVSAQASFERMITANDKIYLQDGEKNVRIFDKAGNLVEEKTFKEPIINMFTNVSQVVYVSKSEIYSDKKDYAVQEVIDKSILLSNNKLIVFFNGGIRTFAIPY